MTLILLVGPNGVGKSSVSRVLHHRLVRSALLESEWCRMTNPFTLHEASITLTIGNITHMLRSYLACSWLDYVIFPYGFHGPRQRIWERVVSDIQDLSHVFVPITLTCDENENVARMTSDGRDDSRIKRALSVRHIYDELRYQKLDTTGLTIDQTADWVISLVNDRTR